MVTLNGEMHGSGKEEFSDCVDMIRALFGLDEPDNTTRSVWWLWTVGTNVVADAPALRAGYINCPEVVCWVSEGDPYNLRKHADRAIETAGKQGLLVGIGCSTETGEHLRISLYVPPGFPEVPTEGGGRARVVPIWLTGTETKVHIGHWGYR